MRILAAIIAVAAIVIAAPAFRASAAPGDTPLPSYSTPANPQKDFDEGKKAINAGQYDKGIELMKKVIAANAKHADATNMLAFAYRKKGDLRSAAGYYDQTLKIDANHKGALEYQGEMFLKLGRVDDAVKNRARLAHLCPESCAELKELDRAIADYHKSMPKT